MWPSNPMEALWVELVLAPKRGRIVLAKWQTRPRWTARGCAMDRSLGIDVSAQALLFASFSWRVAKRKKTQRRNLGCKDGLPQNVTRGQKPLCTAFCAPMVALAWLRIRRHFFQGL
jgi:hypothetical protein